MGIEEPVIMGVGKVAKVGGFFASPLGRINLIISSVLFIILIIAGIVESVHQNSLYPLMQNTILRITASDSLIGQSVDDLESSSRPSFSSGVWYKSFPAVLWYWLKFIFNMVASIWFIWFFGYFLYECFQLISSTSQLRSIILAVISFMIISIIAGMIIYNLNLTGKCLVDDRNKNFNAQMENSFPLHGTIKLVTHILNKELFLKVADWTDTSLGRAVSNIPRPTNILNETNMTV